MKMKTLIVSPKVIRAVVALIGCCVSQAYITAGAGSPVAAQIKIKEYHAFHEVLHPLEHEAVPAKDWQRIRTQADELVKLGNAIVKLGVPQGTAEKYVAEFRTELNKFEAALKQFNIS